MQIAQSVVNCLLGAWSWVQFLASQENKTPLVQKVKKSVTKHEKLSIIPKMNKVAKIASACCPLIPHPAMAVSHMKTKTNSYAPMCMFFALTVSPPSLLVHK